MKVFKKCRERDSNPHSHHWPRDFKSLVSTNSTITARQSIKSSAKVVLILEFSKIIGSFFHSHGGMPVLTVVDKKSACLATGGGTIAIELAALW